MTVRFIGLMLIVGAVAAACGSTYSTGDKLSPGERLFRRKCRSCHVLPETDKYTDEQWVELVRRYGGRINMTEQEIQQLISYVQSAN